MKKTKTSDAETTAAMLSALAERYQRPEWVFLTEVPDGTGSMASRRADAVAYNLFPSKGNMMLCFELKASKSDLKRELADGVKSNAVGQFADYFFLVCPDGVVDDTMLLPKTWGVLTFKGGKLKQTRKPEELKPAPIDKNFAAALLQSMLRANDAEISHMNNKIGEIVHKKLQEQLEYYTRMKEQEWQRSNERMKAQLDFVFAWKNAMEKCYHEDYYDFLRSKDNQFFHAKSLDEVLADDNLIRDLSDFITLRRGLAQNAEFSLNMMRNQVKKLEKTIDGMNELFLRPAAYMKEETSTPPRTKEEIETQLGIPLFADDEKDEGGEISLFGENEDGKQCD